MGAEQRVPILLYHSVGEDRSGPLGPYSCPPQAFRDQMAWIVDEGFSTLTLRDLTEVRRGVRPLPPRPLAISFDDGLADFLTNALPTLRSHGLTATMFVTTAAMWRTRPRALGGRPTMSRSEVAEVARGGGVQVGAHSHEHLQLDLQGRAEVSRQLAQCKDQLEQTVQETVDAFAYPHGYHRAVTRRLVRRAGFTSACAVRNEISHVDDNPFALARIMLTSDQSVAFLRQALAPDGARVSRGRSRLRSHAWRWVRRVRTRGRPLVEVSLV